ncbi:hypothetical protein Gohar_026761 [Gossypium harknessii]|uniref:Uncharacterized protein n=1 Tax=Gossypium harknessii TaxID=34285 RepID=A0A7J9HSJ6_9ROSI|nr:hypothetical protein [Gossypium harknessii]
MRNPRHLRSKRWILHMTPQ